MAKGLNVEAYTIVEVMIALAISGLLILTAMLFVSGQQRRTEFNQSIRDIESQIQDTANDITTGYYAATNTFSCTSTGSGPNIVSAGSSNLGANAGCIFMGNIMQFGVAGSNNQDFAIYTVVGQRQIGSGANAKDVSNFTEADPTVIAPTSTSPNIPNSIDNRTLQYGLTVNKMYYVDSVGTQTNIGAVAFMSTLAQYDPATGELNSGTPSVNVLPVPGTTLGQDTQTAAAAMNAINTGTPINPAGGVVICFLSAGTDQYGQITLGSNGRALTTKLTIGSGGCP